MIIETLLTAAIIAVTPAIEKDTTANDSTVEGWTTYTRAPSDAHCSVELSIEWPTTEGNALADSLRAYIAQESEAFYIAQADGISHPAKYKGSISDGKALTDFHADSLLADLQKAYKAWTADTGTGDTYLMNRSSIRLASQNDSIVALESDCYTFEGGAHGSYWLEGATFRKSDGSRIEVRLDPLKVDDMQALLRDGFEKYLKDSGSETTVDDIIKGGLFLADGLIPLPSTEPYLTADGVKFVYQQYEIGPYALGTPTFIIPLDKLKGFLEN